MKSVATIFLALLPVVVASQEVEQHTVDEESLGLFLINRIVGFEYDENNISLAPWLQLLPCDDCIYSHNGYGKYRYRAVEVYPDERLVEIEIFAGVDHWLNPIPRFVYPGIILARVWEGQLYYLSDSPVWVDYDDGEAREYVTHYDSIEEIDLSDLTQRVEDFDCVDLVDSMYTRELMRSANIEVIGDEVCAVRGVYVEDLVRALGQPKAE